MTTPGNRLRALIADERILVAPGAYEAITARSLESRGVDASHMTGAGTVKRSTRSAGQWRRRNNRDGGEHCLHRSGGVAAVCCDFDTGYGTYLTTERLQEIGFSTVIFPMLAFRSMLEAVDDALVELRDRGTQVDMIA